MYMYTHTHTKTHTNTHTHTHPHTRTHTHSIDQYCWFERAIPASRTCVYTHIYACKHTHIQIHTHTHVCVYVCILLSRFERASSSSRPRTPRAQPEGDGVHGSFEVGRAGALGGRGGALISDEQQRRDLLQVYR